MRAPHYSDDAVTLWHGDCLAVLRELDDASVDAVVTDPPYGLEFMGRDWDSFKPGGKRPRIGEADGSPHRRNTGTPSWAASGNPRCLNCGGTKYDRTRPIGCSCDAPSFPVESAGHMRAFQEWCTEWAIECLRVLKPGGHMVAFGGSRTWHRLAAAVEDAGFEIRDSIAWLYGSGFPKSMDVSRAIDSEAGDPEWLGWGTALKPAFEPIVVGRKSLAGTVAMNVLAHGVGGLNIDACRTAAEDSQLAEKYASVQNAGVRENSVYGTDSRSRAGSSPHELGRWPTNVVLDGSQSEALGNGAMYFPTFHYEAKAPTEERPVANGVAHPTVKPLDLMRWLVRLVTPPGGTVLEPFAGSGTTAEACVVEGFRCIAIEREADYLPLIVQRLSKPIQLDMFGGEAS